MKIVIDIPEEIYNRATRGFLEGFDIRDLRYAIKNGTPLPKGHGDLIDISDIEPMRYTVDGDDYFDDYEVIDWEDIEKVPTIIEADKTESENKK